jgi:hypothetical protein
VARVGAQQKGCGRVPSKGHGRVGAYQKWDFAAWSQIGVCVGGGVGDDHVGLRNSQEPGCGVGQCNEVGTARDQGWYSTGPTIASDRPTRGVTASQPYTLYLTLVQPHIMRVLSAGHVCHAGLAVGDWKYPVLGTSIFGHGQHAGRESRMTYAGWCCGGGGGLVHHTVQPIRCFGGVDLLVHLLAAQIVRKTRYVSSHAPPLLTPTCTLQAVDEA